MQLPPPSALACPPWFASAAHWPEAASEPNLRGMLSRPPVWVRVQTDAPAAVRTEFASLGLLWEESAIMPGAWRVSGTADLTETAAFANGAIEVQDLGSQMILGAVSVRPGARWLDACAGAGGASFYDDFKAGLRRIARTYVFSFSRFCLDILGGDVCGFLERVLRLNNTNPSSGKTLQLVRLLGPSGSVDAVDVRQSALDELRRRAKRAGLAGRVKTTVEDSSGAASSSGRGQVRPRAATQLLALPSQAPRRQQYPRLRVCLQVSEAPPYAAPLFRPLQYDGVLVDAPCTGSGTWRRSPHLRWQLQEADVLEMAQTQGAILRAQAGRVRPGGLLVYATCSLSHSENGAHSARATSRVTVLERRPYLVVGVSCRISEPSLTSGWAGRGGGRVVPGFRGGEGFRPAPARASLRLRATGGARDDGASAGVRHRRLLRRAASEEDEVRAVSHRSPSAKDVQD